MTVSISGPISGPADRPVIEHAARIERARTRMAGAGIDALLLSVGTDLPYLIGYRAMASERLTMAVIPAEGRPTLLVPELEAPRVDVDPTLCAVVAWGETEQPVDLVADRLAGVEHGGDRRSHLDALPARPPGCGAPRSVSVRRRPWSARCDW